MLTLSYIRFSFLNQQDTVHIGTLGDYSLSTKIRYNPPFYFRGLWFIAGAGNPEVELE